LIKTIEVGWNNPMLRDGLVLVDLPGVGVANDEYRRVTAEAIRSARAIVLVVDRSGFTQASADLLRSTGFLNSLLHDGHDAEADVPVLILAVVKLDLTADDARREVRDSGESPKPWLHYFEEACSNATVLVRDQLPSFR
jgi:predicted GTPase